MEANETMQERLSTLWNQGSRDLAVAFFRRAIGLDMTLAELAAALQFDHVVDHLAQIRLRDILARSEPTPHAPRPPQVNKPSAVRDSKRSRRSPAQSRKVRTLLMDMITAAPDGIDTRQLSSALQDNGIAIDVAKCNMVLKDMERALLIVGDDGRPRVWRLKVQGRAMAEPIVIRKSQDPSAAATTTHVAASSSSAPSASAPASPSSVSLLSQSEVKSAADVLRARFFSAKTHG